MTPAFRSPSRILAQLLPEAKLTLKLAFPIVFAQLGVVLMGVTDTIMIGRLLGKEALAAAGLGTSLSFVIASIAVGGIPVIGPIIAKKRSAQEHHELSKIFRATMSISTRYAIAISGIACILFFNFHLLGQPKSVEYAAKVFFIIICASNIPLFYFIGLRQTFDGFSRPQPAMYITFLGLLANFLLNYVFIEYLGLNGAAYSTLSVRIIMLAALAIYFLYSQDLKLAFIKPHLKGVYDHYTKQFIRLSIPSGLQFFFEIAAFSSALVMMGWISANALAAHQIAINIAATTYMMAGGLAFAGGIRVGDALGLANQKQVKIAGTSAFGLVFVFMSLTMCLIFTFRHSLVQLYIDDSEIEFLAQKLLIIAAIFQLSDGLQVVALGNLRGLSDVKIPAYVTFMAYWLIALPLGYYLAFHTTLSAIGIWIALLIGLSVAGLLLIIRFYNQTHRLDIPETSGIA
ncbi:MATE family efflux transporter [Marinilongibacter aquaticus]|uniref:MATE family efflux transporter n=1 Tax=Marinilongibacter aquaticus TaxID=2975157 RepID=UPI0021BCFD78|nr:MATE family efflux transporter [Marinilongibacter aquaticus]UBM57861.1 MATE family efflux transporter [Marinilongibacter aquaticus]